MSIDPVEQHYQIKVERVYSELSSEEQASIYGASLWNRDPDQCCRLRKVQPLRKKLSELRAWCHRHPPGADADACTRAKGGTGRKVRIDKS